MERRRNEKRTSGRMHMERGGRGLAEEEEDYGDYVTRCICEFKHDDGYMICCDDCSVWQHVECMQVDPKNLPENYLCEMCEPRPVDKRRAQKIQQKKRDDISDAEEKKRRRAGHTPMSRTPLSTSNEGKKVSSLLPAAAATPGSGSMARKRKRGKPGDTEHKMMDSMRKNRKEKCELSTGSQSVGKKQRRRIPVKGAGNMGSSSSIQSLLTAASLLEDNSKRGAGQVGGGKITPMRRKSDLWNGERSPWTEKYETAEQNLYTEPIRAFLMSRMDQLKSEEVVYNREEYITSVARPHPQCVLAEVAHKRKGVVVQEPVPQDELVMECKGKIAVKQDILSDLVTGSRTSSLWKHKPCPFVYLYDKIANIDLCIDSRNYGNLTRFIRRSCCPNAEVRHFFVSSELHFGVYALNHISHDEEVTLAFDFRYDKCDYPVECACGQSQTVCLVAGGKHPVSSSREITSEEDYRSQPSSLQRSHSHVFLPQDEDSNSSWTSTGSYGRKRSRLTAPPSSLKPEGSCGPSREVSSDSEEESDKRRKSLSREERKTEQVWRVFEKMEATAQRRRQQLLSEGSHDSDPLSSPTPFHPLTSRTLKDRCSTRNKAQMLPVGKMRLSSVSSTDPLSPYDPSCEPFFSPPITPGTGHSLPAGMQSPLLSPTSPTPHFQAAPQLHPKYLFADFSLPWKKAILRQWESEQANGHTSLPRSYWASSNPFLDCHVMTRDMMRPRTRGCLKHRWLKHYNESSQQTRETGHVTTDQDHVNANVNGSALSTSESDKENSGRSRLSHKKLVLLRWQGSAVPDAPMDTLPDSSHKPIVGVANGQGSPQKVSAGGVASGQDSPLFEEFSDSEEFVDHHTTSCDATAESALPQASPASPVTMTCDLVSPLSLPDTDVGGAKPEALVEEDRNMSGVSDISSESVREPLPSLSGPQTPPLSDEATGVSDISSDNMDTCGTDEPEPQGIVESVKESYDHSDDGEVGGTGEVREVTEALDDVSMAGEKMADIEHEMVCPEDITGVDKEPSIAGNEDGVSDSGGTSSVVCTGDEVNADGTDGSGGGGLGVCTDGPSNNTDGSEGIADRSGVSSDGITEGFVASEVKDTVATGVQAHVVVDEEEARDREAGTGGSTASIEEDASRLGQVGVDSVGRDGVEGTEDGTGSKGTDGTKMATSIGVVCCEGHMATTDEANSSMASTEDCTDEGSVDGTTGELVQDYTSEVGGRPPPLDTLGVAPSSPLSSQPTPTKTPGKRKITYTEYRSRTRKPAERKTSDKSCSSPPPPSTPGTPSFLAHSFFTSSSLSTYTSAMHLSAVPPGPAPTTPAGSSPSQADGSAPHFEPVSPEDGDHTPKLLGSHDDLGAPVPSVPLGSGGVASLPYAVQPGSTLYSSFAAVQQAPPPGPSGSVPAYLTEGGLWVTADQAQDPRNRPPGVAPMSSGGLGNMAVLQQPGGGVPMVVVPQASGGVSMGLVPSQPQASVSMGLMSAQSQAGGAMHQTPQPYPTPPNYYQVQQTGAPMYPPHHPPPGNPPHHPPPGNPNYYQH